MGEALHNLGIDLTGLIAQAVNFGLVLFVLWKFLYTPILKMFNDRSQKIEDSLKKADEINKEYEKIEQKKEKLLVKAQQEAAKVVEDAREESKAILASANVDAQARAKAVLANAEADGQKVKSDIVETAKDEIAKLVEESLTSLLKNDTKKYDDALINEALAGFIEKG